MHTARCALGAALTLLVAACGEETSGGEVLLEYPGFGPAEQDLRKLTLLLSVRDEHGDPARLRVWPDGPEGESLFVRGETPLRCDGGACTLSFEMPAGRYAVHIDVRARDRCATETLLGRLFPAEGTVFTFAPGAARFLAFVESDFGFDDDGDGIENALELAACGRFDVPDRAAPPQACAFADDPCCKGSSPLIGRMTRFEGSNAHLDAEGELRAVGPFLLDATEATWGMLERCVLAGGCLAGQPSHPGRQALADPALSRSQPVVGLSPREADELCRWLGKQLPTDLMWDFAAAYRSPGVRARYPWDGGGPSDLFAAADALADGAPAPLEPASLGCHPRDPPPSANHAGPAGGCLGEVAEVGSFPQSHIHRGSGPPVADMAGNVFEWTLERVAPGEAAPDDARVPPGVRAVRLRGGGFSSPPPLLENDLSLRVTSFARDLDGLLPIAGFRCAVALPESLEAAEAEVARHLPSEEPVCAPLAP